MRPLEVATVRDERLCSRVHLELLTASGLNARIEFRIRCDTVELWHHEHLAAAFDRAVLAEWLNDPTDAVVVDEVELSVDWHVDVTGRVALTLPDVNAWTLSPTELDNLYRRVVIDTPRFVPKEGADSMLQGLTERQVEMLVFLADRRDSPPAGAFTRLIPALKRRGLVQLIPEDNNRWRPTEAGRRAIESLLGGTADEFVS